MQERVRGARQEIEQGAQETRLQIVALSDDLSSRVIKAVLPVSVPTEVAQ
jgi:F-type H+-transporting ATPase subunit b